MTRVDGLNFLTISYHRLGVSEKNRRTPLNFSLLEIPIPNSHHLPFAPFRPTKRRNSLRHTASPFIFQIRKWISKFKYGIYRPGRITIIIADTVDMWGYTFIVLAWCLIWSTKQTWRERLSSYSRHSFCSTSHNRRLSTPSNSRIMKQVSTHASFSFPHPRWESSICSMGSVQRI